MLNLVSWGVGVIGLAVLAGWLALGSADQEEVERVAESSPVPTAAGSVETTGQGGPIVEEPADDDGLSLTAFARQQFTGSDFKVGRVLADNAAYTRHYITYRSNGLLLSGIMNVPKGEGVWPLLVLNHGFIDPAVYTNGRGLKREQDYLARQGYVVVHSDYRNHADSDDDPQTDQRFRLGYVEDVINIIGALEEADLPYVDLDKVGMVGHSMGGGIAWRVAVARPGLVDAFVQLAPVSVDERDNFEKWIRRRRPAADEILAEYGEPADSPLFWDNISPLTYLDQVQAPVMIHHGTADESVPLAWSERAADRLVELNKDVTLHVYPGEPHEFAAAWGQVMRRTADFFDRHLE